MSSTPDVATRTESTVPSTVKIFKTRIRYYVPVLKWMPAYNIRTDLIKDTIAGITVALLLIPQSLSYSSGLAKLDPIYGLYTSFFPTVIYSLLGTSRHLSVGPEALVSLLVGNALSKLSTSNSMDENISYAVTICLMVGLITFALGLTRMGFIDSVLSRALLRGFITAVACVIVIEQLPQLLGIPHSLLDTPQADGEESYESPFSKFVFVLEHVGSANWVAVLISIFSITFLISFKKFQSWLVSKKSKPLTRSRFIRFFGCLGSSSIADEIADRTDVSYESFPASSHQTADQGHSNEFLSKHLPIYKQILFYIPDILVAVGVAIIVSYSLDLRTKANLPILGNDALNNGFKIPILPTLTSNRFKSLFTTSLLISILGFVESIVAAKNYGSKYQYTVSANRELVAFGVVNIIGSLFNCFPAFASIARSHVNDKAGAKTQLAGMVTSVVMFFTILFILPIFYYMPKASMASIVFVAALGLLEYEDALFLWKIRAWPDIGLMLLTFIITIFWSVESGTLISICLSLVLVVKQSTSPKMTVLGKIVDNSSSVDGNFNLGKDLDIKVKYRPLHEIFQNREEHLISTNEKDILIFKLEEALHFANTGQFKDRLRRAEAYGGWMHIHPGEAETLRIPTTSIADRTSDHELFKRDHFSNYDENQELIRNRTNGSDEVEQAQSLPQLRGVVFDIENVSTIDASAMQTLIEVAEEYHERKVSVCFVKLSEQSKSMFIRSGLLGEVIGSDHFFRKIGDAVNFLREKWAFEERGDGLVSSYSAYNVL